MEMKKHKFWLPLSLFGWSFWLPILLAGLILTITLSILDSPLAWAAGAITLVCLAFFRDPVRRIPVEAGLLTAPADGKVTQITLIEREQEFGGPALKIGIFLSVLDVHINRSPCDGVVERVDFTPGEFLDARHPESGIRNQSTTVVLQTLEQTDPRKLIVRQIVGAIARRIICPVHPGERLRRGERFGMIAFGSRTELIVSEPDGWEVLVQTGQQVKAGSSVMLRRRI
jgi:phosphatidylserine decarboxylase